MLCRRSFSVPTKITKNSSTWYYVGITPLETFGNLCEKLPSVIVFDTARSDQFHTLWFASVVTSLVDYRLLNLSFRKVDVHQFHRTLSYALKHRNWLVMVVSCAVSY